MIKGNRVAPVETSSSQTCKGGKIKGTKKSIGDKGGKKNY